MKLDLASNQAEVARLQRLTEAQAQQVAYVMERAAAGAGEASNQAENALALTTHAAKLEEDLSVAHAQLTVLNQANVEATHKLAYSEQAVSESQTENIRLSVQCETMFTECEEMKQQSSIMCDRNAFLEEAVGAANTYVAGIAERESLYESTIQGLRSELAAANTAAIAACEQNGAE